MKIPITIVAAAVLFSSIYSQETCSKVGLACSRDCTTILACIKEGKSSYSTMPCINLYNPSYCKYLGNGAICGADIADCDEDPTKVICGSTGHFPHPTIPSASLICNEKDAPPDKICYCSPEFPVVDATVREVSCRSKHKIKPKKLVNCIEAGDSGVLENGLFNYTCKSSGEIIVGHTEKYKPEILDSFPFRNCISPTKSD